MSDERQPRHRGPFVPPATPKPDPPHPRHRGTSADQELGRLLQDFERAQRAADEAPYEMLRRWHGAGRDGFAAEIDRRILP